MYSQKSPTQAPTSDPSVTPYSENGPTAPTAEKRCSLLEDLRTITNQGRREL